MRKDLLRTVTLFLFAFTFTTNSFAEDLLSFSKDNILGFWYNDDHSAIIGIYKDRKTKEYIGKIVWLQKSLDENGKPRIDENNPDPRKAKRNLLRLQILEGFSYKGANTWVGGHIYDPKNGKSYSCTLKLKKDNQLHVRGYVGISLFGRTAIWSKLTKDDAKRVLKTS